MRDRPPPPGSPRVPTGWDEAFARLAPEPPPPDGWTRLSAALAARHPAGAGGGARRAGRSAGWLVLAAVLALAVVVPWRMPDTSPPDRPADDRRVADAPPAAVASFDPPRTLQSLHAESARLEVLLAHARDGRVATGSAAALSSELESRLAAIDAALAEPGLSPARERTLWTERVAALRTLAGFEGTRRWLAANGEQYDGALVQVN